MDLADPKPDGLLARGYVASGPHRGAEVATRAVGAGWETWIRLPKEEEATLWGRYQDRPAALYGHDAAMSWVARGPSAARRPAGDGGGPADHNAHDE